MAFERIMGIYVTDDSEYQCYRDAMMPILTSFGGAFGYDFTVAKVLRSKTDADINRVFTIEFPSQLHMEDFFSDAAYLAVKERHFIRSVSSTTTISLHEKEHEKESEK